MERGRLFWKMTGSGNDFVFFDARTVSAGALERAQAIDAICAQRTGIGADGVVFFEPGGAGEAFSIRYFNRDGSLAELCGNASLCGVRLARDLAAIPEGEFFTFGTSSGPMRGRLEDAQPEIETVRARQQVTDFQTALEPGEQRIGYVRVGVPHLVVLVDEVSAIDVERRGAELRSLPELVDGANANFISPINGGWAVRTFERGVERETLACGTGAVACAQLLASWGLSTGECMLRTLSGRELAVRFRKAQGARIPILRGEGRLVYRGELGDIPGVTDIS